MVIAWSSSHRELEEQPLTAAAAKLGKDPVDLALDIALADDLQTRFRMAVMNFDEKEVAELITDPNTIIALSDAGAHANQLCDACYSTYLLAHWVRERGTFTIEQAVHNLTQRPAETFGITDRGVLAEGRPADVVVFDPKTVGPGPLKRVYDLPAGADRLVSEAHGIAAVIVNGQIIRRDGKDAVAANDRLPGRVLRNGRQLQVERENIMIHVIAVITAKPGKRDEILGHFRANVPAVQAEKGCIEYGATVDADGWARSRPSSVPTPSSWSRNGRTPTR